MSSYTAGVIVIGDEILSGRTQDTNSNFIADKLTKEGIKLEEILVIQDVKEIIKENVINFSSKYSYVFTTGGIGPTHDDITSESISEAFQLNCETNIQAFEILNNYYPEGEFNESRQRMAKMPVGSELILNPMTAAPGFKIKNIFVLPGVPEIMQVMFLELIKTLKKGKAKLITTINTNLYESKIAIELKNIQNNYKDASIGSYPYFNLAAKSGGVNIVVSSWTITSLDPIIDDITNMIELKGGKSSIV
ncbi:molybdopterin-binding protein [Pelagibacteraceae bacterium]|nr:molybdopterin-binding protein [Pelagibacteraceae bacterium]|tara:strand:- start:59 stop:805 length:747 start_codon:yes stop_codon:yes gene_type:complete